MSSQKGTAHSAGQYRRVTVEPVLLLGTFALSMVVTLRTQYTNLRVAESHNVTSSTNQNVICYPNESDSTSINDEIQSETSLLITYMSVAEFLPPLFVSMIVGSWSESHGRKFAMVIPSVAFVVACALYLIFVYMEAPVYYLIGVNFIQGLGGDVGLFQAACFAYMADITHNKPRMFRMVILETTIYAGSGLSQVCLEYLLKSKGYKASFWLAFAVGLSTIIWIITPGLLKESIHNRMENSGTLNLPSDEDCKSQTTVLYKLQQIPKLFTKRENEPRRQFRLIVILTIFFLFVVLWTSFVSLVALYGLGQPFCWAPVTLGYYTAAGAIFPGLGMLIGGKLLGLCLSKLWIIQISFISSVTQAMLTAVAPNTLCLLLSTAGGSLRTLAAPMTKTLTADLVSENEQGIAFATIACLQSIGGLISPLLLYSIYSATTSLLPQFTFYFVASMCLIPMGLTRYTSLKYVLSH
ncbi:proton-coupled folate transporter-like [Antedon mediterranea]|uniref:proton-coupled folate transporter-like n=1 Tax=Antedon mediterranea TaxID=105859 RepID=UPI003AF88C6F